MVPGTERIGRPLPNVAGHVVQTEAEGPERIGGHRAHGSARCVGEFALEGVHPRLPLGFAFGTPRVGLLFVLAARGVLPFGFAGQADSRPGGEGLGIPARDMRDRMIGSFSRVGAGAFGCVPGGAGDLTPPRGRRHRRCALLQFGGEQAGEDERVAEGLGIRDMTGVDDEGRELGHGHRGRRQCERRDLDSADRSLSVFGIGQRIFAAHEELTSRQCDHRQILRGTGRQIGQQSGIGTGRFGGRFPARHSHLGGGFFFRNTHLGGPTIALPRSSGRLPVRSAA